MCLSLVSAVLNISLSELIDEVAVDVDNVLQRLNTLTAGKDIYLLPYIYTFNGSPFPSSVCLSCIVDLLLHYHFTE